MIRAAGPRSHRDNAGVRRGERGSATWEGFRPVSALHKGTPMGVSGRPRLGDLRGLRTAQTSWSRFWGAWANISIHSSQVVPATRQVPAVGLQETLENLSLSLESLLTPTWPTAPQCYEVGPHSRVSLQERNARFGAGWGEGRPRSPPLVQAYFITRNLQGPNEAIHGP